MWTICPGNRTGDPRKQAGKRGVNLLAESYPPVREARPALEIPGGGGVRAGNRHLNATSGVFVDEKTALLRAICEDPADDTVRLVYADFLEENGEAERAEFVRLQIWQHQNPIGYNDCGESRRVAELLDKHLGRDDE